MFRFYKQVEENVSLSADFLLEVGLYKSDFFSTAWKIHIAILMII